MEFQKRIYSTFIGAIIMKTFSERCEEILKLQINEDILNSLKTTGSDMLKGFGDAVSAPFKERMRQLTGGRMGVSQKINIQNIEKIVTGKLKDVAIEGLANSFEINNNVFNLNRENLIKIAKQWDGDFADMAFCNTIFSIKDIDKAKTENELDMKIKNFISMLKIQFLSKDLSSIVSTTQNPDPTYAKYNSQIQQKLKPITLPKIITQDISDKIISKIMLYAIITNTTNIRTKLGS